MTWTKIVKAGPVVRTTYLLAALDEMDSVLQLFSNSGASERLWNCLEEMRQNDFRVNATQFFELETLAENLGRAKGVLLHWKKVEGERLERASNDTDLNS